MVELRFYILDEDCDRLFAAKDQAGRGDLTGNEYARMLLERELRRLVPYPPKPEEFDSDQF